jgi:Domain of unknown function (DUF4157)
MSKAGIGLFGVNLSRDRRERRFLVHLSDNGLSFTPMSKGSPLDPGIKAFMEDRFYKDFSDVRLHTDPFAAKSAASLNAEAFTLRTHIFFAEGYYDPSTEQGRWLIAHELAHVVQQSENGSLANVNSHWSGRLEGIANRAADLVALGQLPHDFAFGIAPKGDVQRHVDEECPGTSYSARDPSIWMAANEAIELAYKEEHPNNVVFYGSDFENSLLKIGPEMPYPVPHRRPFRPGVAEVILPRGVRNQRFGNILLRELRGLERQRRPDIIDFTKRAFYEIKSTGYADRGTVQLRSYYKITESILMHHGEDEPPWRLETAPPWYPKHVLSMLSPNPASLSLVVCTQATNHTEYPGMILYEVRRIRRRRRRQRPRQIEIRAFWSEYDVIRPVVRESLKKGIKDFDPDSPEYVIIIPHEFFSLDWVKRLTDETMKRRWEPFKMQSQYSRNRIRPMTIYGLEPDTIQAFMICIIVAGVITVAIIITGGVVLEGLAVGVTALTAVEAGATVEAGAAIGTTATIEQTIVVPASIASQVAGGTAAAATAAETATVASYTAIASSSAAKAVAASAGVLIILGTGKSAEAAPSKATIEQIVPVLMVPIDEFKLMGATPTASSADLKSEFLESGRLDRSLFEVGRKVIFDNKQHWIFGRVTVQ